ncbi:hypothetical protein RND81_07G113100 [Saponaria officinalis]|uniref:Uncharacterized protein n=1 Tax=Saponaria officinalis TaxID=3572 RepID=A0AAW1JQQ4_SAPOF
MTSVCKSNPLFCTLLIFSTYFIFSLNLSNAFLDSQPSSFSGEYKLENSNNNNRRSLAENTENNSSPLILAEKNTHRRDPLNHFKRYSGGWNISDQHYWGSVAFTAAPFFIVAAVWWIIFGLSLICTCFYFCCCRSAPYGYSRVCYALSLILLILFTVAAIIGCIFLYTGQGKFHASTTTTLHYVVNQANFTVENLKNVSGILSEAKNIGVGQVKMPENLQNQINDVQSKINKASDTLQDKTQDNSRKIRKVLDQVRIALIILAAVMLGLAFIGFLLSIFGLQCLVYTLIILGWILVTLTFILCGVFLVLHNVVADTCIAMDQWVLHPTQHTALDDILPCVDNATAQETLLRSKDATNQLASMVDLVLSTLANSNPPPSSPPPLYYNQSGPSVPLLCNPLNSDLTDRKCAPGEVDFSNATQVWKNYVCEAKKVNGNEICTTRGRLTPTIYSQMNSAERVAFGLNHYTPFLVDLQDCTFVRTTFSDFSANYCPGLRKYTQWIYSGLVLVSAAVMCSLIFWAIYSRERRHRVYTKQFFAEQH